MTRAKRQRKNRLYDLCWLRMKRQAITRAAEMPM